MGVHDGHRERMREKFFKFGGSSFQNHELIEMLLYYCYPRKDTNEKAHNVLEKFGGSITRLVYSDTETLMRAGLSEGAAVLVGIMSELYQRISIEKWSKKVTLDSSSLAGEFALSYLDKLLVEKLYIVCMDNSMSVIRCVEITNGSPGMVYMEMRTLVEIAMDSKAYGILIMHNHPSGNVKPSDEDMDFTRECKIALDVIDVKLLDHIIVGDGKYLSMKYENILPE